MTGMHTRFNSQPLQTITPRRMKEDDENDVADESRHPERQETGDQQPSHVVPRGLPPSSSSIRSHSSATARRSFTYPPRRADDETTWCGFVSEASESTMERSQVIVPAVQRRPQQYHGGSPGTTSLSSVAGDESSLQPQYVMQFVMPETQYTQPVRKVPDPLDMTLSEDDDENDTRPTTVQQQHYHSSFRQSSVRSLQSVEEDRPLQDDDEYSSTSSNEQQDAYIHALAAASDSSALNHRLEHSFETTHQKQTHVRETAQSSIHTPTYICPRCGTRQREFFTTDNVAGSLEGPASYLALYFSIYVICSLFIFGLEEGWMPLDCIYFAVLTLTTAGLGDFVPTSTANKLICSIFIYFGVACIGLLLGSYIAGMLDTKATLDRQRQHIDACGQCARIRTQAAAAVAKRHMRTYSERSDVRQHFHRGHNHADVLGSPGTRQFLGRQKHTRHTSIDITRQRSFGSPLTKRVVSSPWSAEPMSDTPTDYDNDDDPTSTEDERYGDTESLYSSSEGTYTSNEDSMMWDQSKTKLNTAKYVFLTLRTALANSMVIIAVGCVGFHVIEGFSIVDSWYFTTVLLTTVGYGDIVPVTSGGKLFATVYILVAGTVLLNNMSTISMIPLEIRRRRMERTILTQFGDLLDDVVLRELATGPLVHRLRLANGKTGLLDECTREMFSLAMLVRLGKVSEQDIRETFKAFKRLDVNNEGVLNSKSIIAGMIKQSRLNNNESVAPTPSRRRIPPPPPLNDSAPPYGSVPGFDREDVRHGMTAQQQYQHEQAQNRNHHDRHPSARAQFMSERSALLARYEDEHEHSAPHNRQ